MENIIVSSEVNTFLFLNTEDIKIKLMTIIDAIFDKNKALTDVYVKHISNRKYKDLYEIHFQISGRKIRILFAYTEEKDIVLLYAFEKKDSKDTNKALKIAQRKWKLFQLYDIQVI